MSDKSSSDLAYIDDLTGLSNRRSFKETLPQELKEAESRKCPLSLLVLDVDLFKDVNDNHGHQAGDQALATIAGLLNGSLRSTDAVFRYAGDEFAIVLPDTGSDDAVEVAQSLAERIADKSLDIFGKPVTLTVSIGVATYPEDGQDLFTLFDLADRAMLARKRRGRNGVAGKAEVLEERLGEGERYVSRYCPRLVGRDRELSKLTSLFEDKGRLVFVSGEAGIGKTSVLKKLGEAAESSSREVLLGHCRYETSPPPYVAFKEAIGDFGLSHREAVASALSEMEPVYRNQLLELVPGLLGLGIEKGALPELPAEQAKLRLFSSVTQLIRALSEKTPLVVILEDLHCADGSSLEMLHYIARNSRGLPVLICGSYREEEVLEALVSVQKKMRKEKLFESVHLKRLSKKDVVRMVGLMLDLREVPEDLGAAVHRQTEGNPLFVEEVVRSLLQQGAFNGGTDLGTDALSIPDAVKDVIERRVSLIDADARGILSYASVIGATFDFDLLHSVSGMNEGQLYDLMDQAARVQLVREEFIPGADRFSFGHSLMRDVLYDGLTERKRTRMHLSVGEAIEEFYADNLDEYLHQLAHHYYEGKEWMKTFHYSCLAGKRAQSLYANEDSLSCHQVAITAYEKISPKKRLELSRMLAEAYRSMGDVQFALGRYEDAIVSYKEMRGAARGVPDPALEGRALMLLGTVYCDRGSYDVALESCAEALSIARHIEDEGNIAACLNNAGTAHERKGSTEEALRCYEESLEVNRRIGDRRGISVSLHHLAEMRLMKGEYSVALGCAEEALALSRETGDKQGIGADLTLNAILENQMDEKNKALEHLREALEVAREIGNRFGMAITLSNIGVMCSSIGLEQDTLGCYFECLAIFREIGHKGAEVNTLTNIGLTYMGMASYTEASMYGEEAVAMAREIGHAVGLIRSASVLGKVKRSLGLFEQAAALHEEALSLARNTGNKVEEAVMLGEFALDLVERGKVREAAGMLEEALGMNVLTADSQADMLEGIVRAHSALGDVGKAGAAIDRLESIARKTSSKNMEATVRYWRARCLLANGGLAHAEKALEQYEQINSPEQIWRAHCLLGRILKQEGNLLAAKEHLGESKRIVESIASKISDSDVRKTYLSKTEHQELFAEFEQLSTKRKTGNKKKGRKSKGE